MPGAPGSSLPESPSFRVVKFGGSVAATSAFRPWLSVLGALAGSGIVVVPGGGQFADEVRRAQARHGFSDEAAHFMALLAMEQYGRMLCAMVPAFVAAATADAIAAAVTRGQIPVWMPSNMLAVAMLKGGADVPATWDVTSDTLAAWLAGEIGAESLTLIKSALPDIGTRNGQSAGELAAAGYVDASFPGAVAGRSFRVAVCGPDDQELFRGAVRAGALPGRPVTAAAREHA